MSGRLGIIAGGGSLPAALKAAEPDALAVAFEGVDCALAPEQLTRMRIEKLGLLFSTFRKAGVERVVLAGGMSRPDLKPAKMDAGLLKHLPKVLPALKGGGDDALLRVVVSIIESEGFAVVGAHEILPELTAPAGLIAGRAPDKGQKADAAKAHGILRALDGADVAQACVVENGLCLGIETLQGTDALLSFVAATPDRLRRGKGIAVKRPKAGQDLRIDMPTIGPATLRAVAAAGLSGLCIAARRVLIVDRAACITEAQAAGLTFWAEELT